MAYKIVSPAPVSEGGTGAITLTDHGILVGSGTSAIDAIAMTDGQLLIGKSGAFDPVAASVTSTGGTITITPGGGTLNIDTAGSIAASFPTDAGTATPAVGALTVAGGTNIASAGAGSTVTINLDAALTGLTSVTGANGCEIRTGTTAGYTLLLRAYDNTGASYTTFGTLTANLTPTFDLNTATTINSAYIYRAGGIDVPVADGGTGVSTLTSHGILMGNGVGTVQATAEPTDGQLLIGKTGNFPVLASLTAGAGITITPGAGTISIASTVPGLVWTVTVVDASLVAGNGYIANKAGLLTMTLPATAAIGDILEITNMNTAVGWRIAQNANQYIRLGNNSTTVGVGGYLEATALGDSVKLVCMVAGASTGWIATSVLGNITIV